MSVDRNRGVNGVDHIAIIDVVDRMSRGQVLTVLLTFRR
jgi:hypothetical protein